MAPTVWLARSRSFSIVQPARWNRNRPEPTTAIPLDDVASDVHQAWARLTHPRWRHATLTRTDAHARPCVTLTRCHGAR